MFSHIGCTRSKASEGPSYGEEKAILVVEDEPAVLDVIEKMLKQQVGHHVLTATNGLEALKVYNQHSNDIVLVLTDIAMPEMDGVTFLQRLREQDLDVSVIMMSAYPLEENAEELLRLGISARVQKPVGLAKLAQVVDEVLVSGRTFN